MLSAPFVWKGIECGQAAGTGVAAEQGSRRP